MDPLTRKLFSRRRKAGNDQPSSSGQGESSVESTTPAPTSREKFGLFVLYKPEASEDCNVDIVAVHGLGGDWENTWTDDTSGMMWLKDFLPQTMPRARIFSFGYDSAYVLSNTVSDIDDAARSLIDRLDGERQEGYSKQRPIIFIAHSLGGIVVKRALILASERSDHWKDIRDSAAGLVFFAVPHRGADMAYWANVATNALSFATLGARGNANLVRSLQKNSPEFANISQAFIQPAQNFLVIRTFYETVKIGNQLIVDKDSASLGITNEISVPIHGANHRDICKFEHSESQRYKPVHNALQMIISKIQNNDHTFIIKQARSYWHQAQVTWQDNVSQLSNSGEEFDWILHMPEYLECWILKNNNRPLFIEYDSAPDWQISLARAFEQDLRSHSELLWGFCLERSDLGYLNQFKSSLALSLIGQLITLNPDCFEKVNKALQQMDVSPSSELEAKQFAQKCLSLWSSPFSSNEATWQQYWALLAALLRSTSRDITIILIGLCGETYAALDDGFAWLTTISFDHSNWRSRVGHPFTVRGRCLVIGQSRHSSPQSIRICEDIEIKECLASLYFPELHAQRDRVEKADRWTNQWIWEHPIYKEWHEENSSSLLWIYGKPGSGKSTLATTLLHSFRQQKPKYLTADFFYSARGGPTETSHNSMLRSILYQLLNIEHSARSLYPAFKATFRKLRSRFQDQLAWSYEDLSGILQNLAESTSMETIEHVHGCKFLIILDGLDESAENPHDSPPRTKVLRSLSRFCSPRSHGTFKIIALSRAERDIKGALKATHSIDMMDVNRDDIQKVITLGLAKVWFYMRSDGYHKSHESSDSSDVDATDEHHPTAESEDSSSRAGILRSTPLQPLAEDLLEQADGVFLWVKMIIHEFTSLARSGTCTLGQFQRVRAATPQRLSDLYCDMVSRIRNARHGSPKMARYIFSWLIFAGRTLRIDELREVVAMFDSDQVSSEPNESILEMNRPLQFETYNPTWTALTNVCGGFIEIRHPHENHSEESHDPSVIDCHDYVQLIHQTAKDFILYEAEASILKQGAINSNEMICMICINYLIMTLPVGPKSSLDSNSSIRGTIMFSKIVRHLEDRPLLPYILAQLPSLLNTHQPDDHVTPAYTRLKDYLHSASKEPNTATWTILKHWARSNSLLVDEMEDVNKASSQNQPSLSGDAWMAKVMVAACKLGALNAVKVLLSARKNIVNAEGGLPILSAAQKGDHLMIGELLRNGANTLTWDERRNNPLHLAICQGYTINQTGKKTLPLAVSKQHTRVVEMLLKADVRLLLRKNIDGMMPLDLANALGLNDIGELINKVPMLESGDIGVS